MGATTLQAVCLQVTMGKVVEGKWCTRMPLALFYSFLVTLERTMGFHAKLGFLQTQPV